MTPSYLDPLPGDFDEELGNLDPADMQVVQPRETGRGGQVPDSSSFSQRCLSATGSAE